MSEYHQDGELEKAAEAIVPKPRKTNKTGKDASVAKAAAELRVSKAAQLIRSVGRKYPKELLNPQSIQRICAFLSNQVAALNQNLLMQLASGGNGSFSLDDPVPEETITQVKWHPNGASQFPPPPSPPKNAIGIATAEEAPDKVRVFNKDTKLAPPSDGDIDFVDD